MIYRKLAVNASNSKLKATKNQTNIKISSLSKNKKALFFREGFIY